MAKITVRVPATSANIGPGFDCTGCALTLYNEITFIERDNGLILDGKDDISRNKNSLLFKAYMAALDYMSVTFRGLEANINSNLPVSRGLGSSATIIVAAVIAADYFAGSPMTQEEIFKIATSVEGHPDNIAPAIFGGLTVSYMDGNIPHCVKFPVSEKWNFVALVPNYKLNTNRSRTSLPKSVKLSDAVFNISRSAITLKALEIGDENLLSMSLDDRLHQPFRKNLIKEYDTVRNIAKTAGAAATYISGSGPTVMCIMPHENMVPRLKSLILARCREEWKVIPLTVSDKGAEIIK